MRPARRCPTGMRLRCIKMDISALCDKIALQPHIKSRVLSFAEAFDFQQVDTIQKGYYAFAEMDRARQQVQALLGEDADGIKMLACMLRAAADTYSVYQAKGISEDTYFATIGCFSRFIEETYKTTGSWRFDRGWWTTRQVGCHLFRIGTLEYEVKHREDGPVIGIHIPSDADFSPAAVDGSLEAAFAFFQKYFPELEGADYCCHSWLLDGQLKQMLGKNSNILQFQNRFEILKEGEASESVMEWVFHAKTDDYADLPEKTSLQKAVKMHLLAGGVIRAPHGRLKESA